MIENSINYSSSSDLLQARDAIVLTGDRPTGRLHLGHYAGSLQNRLKLQTVAKCQYIMIADLQALTDNYENPEKVRKNIIQLMYDYISIGLDPEKNIFFLQSQLPALCELTCYYLNLVTVAQLGANPTVRQEMKDRGFEESLPAGFFCYPVSQAADITAFQADFVPVGSDQLPMIETTNRIVQRFSACYGSGHLKEVKAFLSKMPRLKGIYGKEKASKSSNNAIFLSDTEAEVREKVFQMYTDPNHLKISDPGQIKDNVVFEYLDAFWDDVESLTDLKQAYERGGVGDTKIKQILFEVLSKLLAPIRERRAKLSEEYLLDLLNRGTIKAQEIAAETVRNVKKAIWKS